jgi:predicted methyltransferase
MSTPPILSSLHARPILQARDTGQTTVTTSLDLGRSTATLQLQPDHVLLPDGRTLTWDDITEISQSEIACFTIPPEGGIAKVQFFSEAFNRFYSLMPTQGAPTMLLAGFPMHRIKDTDPHQDTLSKIKAITPITGRVLDTTTGLGYTAIAAAQTAHELTTIELDPTVLEVCRLNPWSQELFTNPKITQKIGDAYEVVEEFKDNSFSRIIHDPPTFSLAGDLYSETFYRQLYRLLQRNGRLFHYIGDLKSKSSGNVAKGAVRRLQAAGFRRVIPRPQAFGVVAYKE